LSLNEEYRTRLVKSAAEIKRSKELIGDNIVIAQRARNLVARSIMLIDDFNKMKESGGPASNS
jgi:hypothetical protein